MVGIWKKKLVTVNWKRKNLYLKGCEKENEMKKKFQSKKVLQDVVASLALLDMQIESVRNHFDMEYGENSHCDLDVGLSHVASGLIKMQSDLQDILIKYQGRPIGPNYPNKRQVKNVSVSDLQKSLCC